LPLSERGLPVARPELLTALYEAEQRIVHYDRAAPPGESAIVALPGSVPVLISAPHSVRHWRGSDWKQEEEYTAGLGYLLHQETGAHFIYGRYMLNPDPHDDGDDGPYKRALDDLISAARIRLGLDLHGARGDRDFAVALGTMHGETFARREAELAAAFEQHGFHAEAETSLDRLVLNPPRYTGGLRQPTITRYIWHKHGIPTVQVELSAWVRIVVRLESASNARNGTAPHFRGDGARIAGVYAALREYILQTLDALPTDR
jgi:hypothetical protein